jgi:hypothetical protein
MGTMTLGVVVCVCALVCLLVVGGGSAAAASPFEFGSFGSEAGQLNFPSGVAVDASGYVYVGDGANNRVDKFESSGKFVLAWGVGVADGASELQTCTTECKKGIQSPMAGGFEFPTGVAVDASGDVYVVDWAQHRIEKFSSQGMFILMFGGHVNKNGTDVCTASEQSECQAGTQTNEGEPQRDGEFSFWFTLGSFIATGPGNKVYVGDTGRVQVFEPSGVWKEDISLAGLSSEGQPTALAVDSAGDVFLHDNAAEGVREFEANGLEKLTQFDTGSFSVTALTLDPTSGDVYVGDENGGFHVLKYDPAGTELASFGSKTVSGFNGGLAFSTTTGELYATEAVESEEKAGVWALTPPLGPLIGGEKATPSPKGAATLQAEINPENHLTTYHFEYLTEKQFKEDGETFGAGTVATMVATLTGSEFEEEQVEAKLPEGALVPGETYDWRVVATDSLKQTSTGVGQAFEETPSALVEGPWSEDVTSSSVTLAATIDPQGASTSYRLEYGTSTSYEHVLAGNVGAGSAFVPISHQIQELTADTTYHYRLVTSNECIVGRTCTTEGADRTFTTQPAGVTQVALPDGRAWELVTPASTGGTVFSVSSAGTHAASDGSAIAYQVSAAPLGENVASNANFFNANQILSLRGRGGFRTEDIDQPQSPPGEGESAAALTLRGGGSYALFSPDLASSVVYQPPFSPPSSEALAGTPYLRDNRDGSYTPLLTSANTPPGTELLAPEGPEVPLKASQVFVDAGTPDLTHLILSSSLKLTSDAIQSGGSGGFADPFGNLYEWSGGRLGLVNVLPDGSPSCSGGVPPCDAVDAELAGTDGATGSTQRTVSSDGRWVAWTRGTPYDAPGSHNNRENYKGLYVRDMVEEKTVRLGGLGARYQTMSSDGSRISVFYLERGDLYVYDATTGTQTDLTATHGPGEVSAGVQESVSDVSADGSYVYFVANGVLGDGAGRGAKAGNCEPPPQVGHVQVGTCNLYLLRNSGSGWEESRFIATLSSEDTNSWYAQHAGPPDLTRVTSRVSPDGRYLTFMSNGSLTGYDNVDANPRAQGARDEEVYLYDSLSGRLVCVSCAPSGARPRGVSTEHELVVTRPGFAWAELGRPHWLGGSLPGWQVDGGLDTVYQPRYLSDSGRLFFDSSEALVPQDTNGLEDVYEHEPPGLGGCTGASATFNERLGGCVDLISSGTSSDESAFLDASEKGPGGGAGEDVFFLASNPLTMADTDTGFDVWDAHVCSALAPCSTFPVSSPACSSGDSCKAAPASQPELFGPAPSATFSGSGNVLPATAPMSKPLTRAQKLAKALAACRKKKRRKPRQACERTAHKQYAAKRSGKARTIKRGGK